VFVHSITITIQFMLYCKQIEISLEKYNVQLQIIPFNSYKYKY